jgi:predicted exporter
MNVPRARVLIVWLGCIAFAVIVVARAHYSTDLSAFLPSIPRPRSNCWSISCATGPPHA